MRKSFMCVVVTASALFCGLNLYDSFQQARAKEVFFQSRADGYCSINDRNKCVETGTSCRDQSHDDKEMACASWLDPTDIDYCNCLEKPSTGN